MKALALALLGVLLSASAWAQNICACSVSGGAAGPVTLTTISISSAQLLNNHTSPIQIVAAPGANKMILVLGASCNYIFGGTAYSGVSGPSLIYGATSLDVAVAGSCGGFGTSASRVSWLGGGNNFDASANILNQPIMFTDSANWTLGNGTAEISVTYVTVSF